MTALILLTAYGVLTSALAWHCYFGWRRTCRLNAELLERGAKLRDELESVTRERDHLRAMARQRVLAGRAVEVKGQWN